MTSGTSYFGGIPTKIDVDKLLSAFNPQIGELYTHADIAEAIGVKYPCHRYRTVVSQWKKLLLQERNLDLEVERSVGYRVLNDNERVVEGVKNIHSSVRHMGKAVNRVARAETGKLDDSHRRQQDHAQRLMQGLLTSARGAEKQIALAGRVEILPRQKTEAGTK